jgi:hypothetical protein
MSKKQFEENLNYGDCNNLFCFFGNLFEGVVEGVENTITKTKKIVDKSLKNK